MVLASSCDLRVASTTAQFALPEVELGVPLTWGGTHRLMMDLGKAKVKELVLTGRTMDSFEAMACGFINAQASSHDELTTLVDHLADTIASRPRHAVFQTKRAVNAISAHMVGLPAAAYSDAAVLAAAFGDAEGQAAREARIMAHKTPREGRGSQLGKPPSRSAHQLAARRGASLRGHSEPCTLFEAVEAVARVATAREALVEAVPGGRRLSFASVVREATDVSVALRQVGVVSGDHIAMIGTSRAALASVMLGANRTGACFVGLTPKATARELAHVLADTRPTCVIAEPSDADAEAGTPWSTLTEALELAAISPRVVLLPTLHLIPPSASAGAKDPAPPDALAGTSWDEWVSAAAAASTAELDAAAAAAPDPDASALVIYTSGTTGSPKGAVHTNRTVLAYAAHQATGLCMGSGEPLRALCHFPINHVASLVEILFATLTLGGGVVLQPAYHPALSLDAIRDERVSFLGQVPLMFMMQMRMPQWNPDSLASVRNFVFAGAAPPVSMIEAIRGVAHTEAMLQTGWGMTETSGFLTFTSPQDSDITLANTVGAFRSENGFTFRLVCPTTHADVTASGTVGEIRVKGPSLFDGYLHLAEKTDEAFDDEGWFKTSDMAWLNGRMSDMYKSGGENVYPREVEQVLEEHALVATAAVVGVDDEEYGEVSHAFVQLGGAGEANHVDASELAAQLKAHCRSSLANFKLPKAYHVIETLPLLANGKVDKNALKDKAVMEMR